MSHRHRPADGILWRPTALLVAALIGVRVLIAGLTIGAALIHPVSDVDVWRAERIVTSPARPYRDFPVEYMPMETAMLEAIAGDGPVSTQVRLAILALVADLLAFAAIWWGWGPRPATVYLVLGLPLLSLLYLRFDFVVVALAAWAMAWEHRRAETASGVGFAFAILSKLWPVVLLPVLWLHRRWRSMAVGAAIALVAGAAWYVVGGPKAPLQVLSFRGAVGWSVESTVGDLLWIVTRRQIGPQAGAIRIGSAPAWARGLLLLALIGTEIAIWRRASRDGRDPAGGTSLVAVSALLVLSPLFSIQYATWLLPWCALAFEGDERERRAATLATVAVALCGLLTVSYLLHSPLSNVAEKWGLLARNLTMIGVLAVWFWPAPGRRAVPEPAAAA